MANKTNKYYYAEFCPYGIRTISEGDRLMRFETEEERDSMVGLINSKDCQDRAAAVTLKEVSHRYRISDFNNGDRFDEGYLRTCKNKIYFEIAPK